MLSQQPLGHPSSPELPPHHTHPVPLPWGFARGDPGLAHQDGWAQVAQNCVPGTLQTQQMPWEWWLVPWGCLWGAHSPSPCHAPCQCPREGPTPPAGQGAGDTLEWEWAGDSQHPPCDSPNVALGQDAAPGAAAVLGGGRKAIQMEMPCC